MAFNRYTKCVAPGNYSGDFLGSAGFWAALLGSIAAGIFLGPAVALLGFILTAIGYCRWWLYGRLICLGGDRCFIGLVLQIDTPADQSGIGKLDTDYGLYLLPAPSPIKGDANWLQDMPATNDIQGILIEDPRPANPALAQALQQYSKGFTGEPETSYDMVNHDGSSVLTAAQANALGLPTPPDWQPNNFYTPGERVRDSNGNIQTCTPFAQALSGGSPPVWATAVGALTNDGSVQWSCGGPVPSLGTLEVEFEGAGVWDFYQALLAAAAVAGVAAAVCAIPVFGWIACLILSVVAVAIAAIGFAIGLNDDSAQSNADAQVGVLHPGLDVLFVLGTWIYDSAHSGWNELHPVLFAQKIAVVPQADLLAGKPWQNLPQFSEANLRATIDGFCKLANNALDPGTVRAQANPENGWTLHPLVDGCTPAEPPPRIA